MAIWDIFRPLAQQALNAEFITRTIVFVLSMALMFIAILAYRRTKSRKMLFVAIAFLLFGLKWTLNVLDLYFSPGYFFNRAAENVVELFILGSLFMAIFRK